MPWINDDPDCDHCVPVGRTACYYDGHVTTGGRGPFLRIPPPSVLLAMEEVIRLLRIIHKIEPYHRTSAIGEALSALARAEAEAKEAR